MSKVPIFDFHGGSLGDYEVADELLVLKRGKQAVQDFINGRVAEAALDTIPTRVLQGFLKELKDKLG